MIKTRTRSMKAVAAVAVAFLVTGMAATAASATGTHVDGAAQCVASPGQEYIAPTYETVVDVEGWTETTSAGSWWNWSPNASQGPQDYTPGFPTDERGTWQGPHDNGGPVPEAEGTYNVSRGERGNSSWFHRGAPQVIVHETTYKQVMTDPGQPEIDAVTCPVEPMLVAPIALTWDDQCGVENDAFVGVPTESADGTYTGDGDGSWQAVNFTPAAGKALDVNNLPTGWVASGDGMAQFSHTFTNVACPTTTTQYVTIIWKMDTYPTTTSIWPQTLVNSMVTSAPNLAAFDSLLVGKCVGFQVDVYKYTLAGDKAKVDNLISGGFLSSPNHPAEPLIAGGAGTAWKFYQDSSGCAVTPVFPEPVAPTCDADGSLPATPTTEGIEYTWDGNTLYASVTGHHSFTDGAQTSRTYELGSATGYQSSDPEGACYVPPNEPDLVVPVALTAVEMCGVENDAIIGVPTESADGTYTRDADGSWQAVYFTPAAGKTIDVENLPDGWAVDEGGVAQFTHTFTNVACPIEITDVEVTADPPTPTLVCGPNNDTFTIPATVGVTYSDTGWILGQRTISATAQENFTLVGTSSWTFTDVPAAACPDDGDVFSFIPTEELAYTGTSSTTGGFAALAILLLTSGTALVARKVRG